MDRGQGLAMPYLRGFHGVAPLGWHSLVRYYA